MTPLPTLDHDMIYGKAETGKIPLARDESRCRNTMTAINSGPFDTSVLRSSGRAQLTMRRTVLNLSSLLGAFLLLIPKINIISFTGQTAGIRVDDVVTIALAITLLWFPYKRARLFTRVLSVVLMFCLVCLISNIFNILFFQRSNVLYTIRFAEYFVFAFIGYFYIQRHSLRSLALLIFSVNGVVMILQAIHLIGGFASASGGTADVSDRVIGLTGGPWEVGTVLNICVAVLISDPHIRKNRKVIYFLISLGLILLTGARMPLLAEFYLLCILLITRSPSRIRGVASMVVASILLVAGLAFLPSKVAERSSGTFNMVSVRALQQAYSSADVPASGDPTYIWFENTDDSDPSWLARTTKWSVATKTWLDNPVTWMIGVGPGFTGIALDGGWLRVLTETGLLGLGLFLLLLRRVSGLDAGMKAIVVCLAINMLMIDVNIAARVMPLFFFCTGAYANIRQRRAR